MKATRFLGTSREDLAAFPEEVRRRAGHELFLVQVGREPSDFKPMSSVGSGAYEIRLQDKAGAFRVIYGKALEHRLHPARLSKEVAGDVADGPRVGYPPLQIHRRPAMKKPPPRTARRTANIFLELGFPPHEAAVMLLRCELAEALRRWIDREELTQAQAAKRLGIAQPRVSEIVRNRVEKFSLDYLVGLCSKAKIPVTVKAAA